MPRKRRERSTQGWVYFIRCVANGLVKIGFTASDPENRLMRLRTLSPAVLEPMGLIRGAVDDERMLHARFAHHWSHGEWFFPGEDLLAFVEVGTRPWSVRSLSFRRRPVAPPSDRPSLQEWAATTTLEHEGVTRTVAEWSKRSGVTAFQIKCWMSSKNADRPLGLHWRLRRAIVLRSRRRQRTRSSS